jgi:hypothetical protein
MGVIHQNFHYKKTKKNMWLKFQFHHPKRNGGQKSKITEK